MQTPARRILTYSSGASTAQVHVPYHDADSQVAAFLILCERLWD